MFQFSADPTITPPLMEVTSSSSALSRVQTMLLEDGGDRGLAHR